MRVSRGIFAATVAVVSMIAVAAPASALEKLRTGKAIALPFDFTPLDIGMAKGFFQKHGLELEISSFAGSAKLQQALAADAIDLGLGSGPELAFVAKGAPVLGICAYAGPVNLMMVVRPDAGINSVVSRDLKSLITTFARLSFKPKFMPPILPSFCITNKFTRPLSMG